MNCWPGEWSALAGPECDGLGSKTVVGVMPTAVSLWAGAGSWPDHYLACPLLICPCTYRGHLDSGRLLARAVGVSVGGLVHTGCSDSSLVPPLPPCALVWTNSPCKDWPDRWHWRCTAARHAVYLCSVPVQCLPEFASCMEQWSWKLFI